MWDEARLKDVQKNPQLENELPLLLSVATRSHNYRSTDNSKSLLDVDRFRGLKADHSSELNCCKRRSQRKAYLKVTTKCTLTNSIVNFAQHLLEEITTNSLVEITKTCTLMYLVTTSRDWKLIALQRERDSFFFNLIKLKNQLHYREKEIGLFLICSN